MSALIPRTVLRAGAPRVAARQTLSRRALSTTPPASRPRSFKSTAARWAIAAGGVYYLSTSDVLAETRIYPQGIPDTETEEEKLPTVESLSAARRERQSATAASAAPLASVQAEAPTTAGAAGPEDLEEEAHGEGAFNPETGEINWDCPCLGGMAHGPCGEQFRTAFSCFVFSTDEPKGINCIEHFKSMQDCFRAHPDLYGAELTDDPSDEELAANAQMAEDEARQAQTAGTAKGVAAAPYSGATEQVDRVPGANVTATPSASPGSLSGDTGIPSNGPSSSAAKAEGSEKRKRSKKATLQAKDGDEDELVPKAAHDARASGQRA